MGDLYSWLKVGHIVSMVAWMAATFYLPRLFVYHAGAAKGSELSETLKVMERRLYKAIMMPAMTATWIFGLALVWVTAAWTEHWFHAKFLLVLAMSGFHGACARWLRDFAADRNTRPARYFRIANEVPTVLLILIVILVIVRPF